MRIFFHIIFACLAVTSVTGYFDSTKYKQQLDYFCSENKNVCTKEILEIGKQFFKARLKELHEEARRKMIILKEAEKIRKINQIKEERMLQMLRERFLDRHL